MKNVKIPWIYQLRGIAIIAVVVCHQLNLLHTSQYVQLVTMFSVTTMIFLMGVTSAISFRKSLTDRQILFNVIKKIVPVLCAYIVCSMAYLIWTGTWGSGLGLESFLPALLNFNASSVLYYIGYYISFTIMSPALFALANRIKNKKGIGKYILYIGTICICFIIGYAMIGRICFIGASYFPVYMAGIIWGNEGLPLGNRKVTLPIGIVILGLGIYLTNNSFWNYVLEKPMMGLDLLTPKLQMNPPTLSIIIYSAGVIIVGSIIFDFLNNWSKNKILNLLLKWIEMLGKYSLDIFMWHLLIQQIITRYMVFDNIWIRRIVYYTCMFMLPILGRKVYTYLKKQVYKELYDN